MKISPYVYVGLDPKMRPQVRLSKDSKPNPIEILATICEVSKITVHDIVSKKRFRNIVDSRQIFCYIMREKFGYTFYETGRFINRDHTTVIHSCKTHEDKFKFDRKYAELSLKIFDRITYKTDYSS